jgi:hypothetical protein
VTLRAGKQARSQARRRPARASGPGPGRPVRASGAPSGPCAADPAPPKQTVIANAWHHRSDAASSAVAMVGIAGAMAGFPALDPIAGGLVGLMIAKTGGETLLREISNCVG